MLHGVVVGCRLRPLDIIDTGLVTYRARPYHMTADTPNCSTLWELRIRAGIYYYAANIWGLSAELLHARSAQGQHHELRNTMNYIWEVQMVEIEKSKAISRRKAFSLFAIATMIGLGLATTGSDAEAQTAGMTRRGERRSGRGERRTERRTGREERRTKRRQ